MGGDLRTVSLAALALGGCQLVFPYQPPPLPEHRCNGALLYRDDFEDGVLARYWDADSAPNLRESDGALAIENGMAVIGRPFIDVTDRSVTAELTATLPPMGAAGFGLRTGQDPLINNDAPVLVEFDIESTSTAPRLHAYYTLSDGSGEVKSISYDPQAHRFLRLTAHPAEVATARDAYVGWEVSGAAEGPFDEIGTFPFDIRLAQVRFGASSGSTLRVESLDAGDGELCGTDALVDRFDSLDSYRWQRGFTNSCSEDMRRIVDGGGLEFVTPKNDSVGGSLVCGVRSWLPYQIAGHSVTVRVTPTLVAGVTANLLLDTYDGDAEMRVSGSALEAVTRTSNGFVTRRMATYDPDLHRYWRMEGIDDRLVWKTSADGIEFEAFAETNEVPLDYGRILLSVTVAPGAASPATTLFEDFNVAPAR